MISSQVAVLAYKLCYQREELLKLLPTLPKKKPTGRYAATLAVKEPRPETPPTPKVLPMDTAPPEPARERPPSQERDMAIKEERVQPKAPPPKRPTVRSTVAKVPRGVRTILFLSRDRESSLRAVFLRLRSRPVPVKHKRKRNTPGPGQT